MAQTVQVVNYQGLSTFYTKLMAKINQYFCRKSELNGLREEINTSLDGKANAQGDSTKSFSVSQLYIFNNSESAAIAFDNSNSEAPVAKITYENNTLTLPLKNNAEVATTEQLAGKVTLFNAAINSGGTNTTYKFADAALPAVVTLLQVSGYNNNCSFDTLQQIFNANNPTQGEVFLICDDIGIPSRWGLYIYLGTQSQPGVHSMANLMYVGAPSKHTIYYIDSRYYENCAITGFCTFNGSSFDTRYTVIENNMWESPDVTIEEVSDELIEALINNPFPSDDNDDNNDNTSDPEENTING